MQIIGSRIVSSKVDYLIIVSHDLLNYFTFSIVTAQLYLTRVGSDHIIGWP